MGLVSLLPLNLVFPEFEVNSAALGDAHTLFLSEKGQIYSCGWHELGQLGVTK
jgi:alpha-tubulin suppressor-like RCC1 family protein